VWSNDWQRSDRVGDRQRRRATLLRTPLAIDGQRRNTTQTSCIYNITWYSFASCFCCCCCALIVCVCVRLGFGDPVIAVDVTDDGEWVLATCRRYLLAIPTKLDDSNGFEKRMGGTSTLCVVVCCSCSWMLTCATGRKPAPRRLQLSMRDVALLGGDVNFTPARFNVGVGGERSIVTSTG
jgi:hypothetical protein